MKKIEKNSKTIECILKAFLGESGARNRYTYYAKTAKKEGYEQISSIFEETANNEKEHAKRLIKFLGDELITLTINEAMYPVGMTNSTLKNLEFSAQGEKEENTVLYPQFQRIAKEEGYIEVANCFKEIIEVEKVHEKRYLDLIKNIKEDKVFKKDKETIWKCRNCGYHHKGLSAPDICPSCLHSISYFEVYVKNY